MKTIAVTQRVDIIEAYGERRDAIDQRWTELLLSMDLWPLFIPNSVSYLEQFLTNVQVDGVLLTGGNSLVTCGGNAPERDQIETLLLEWATQQNIPLLGVCRGMQVIQQYFGNTLKQVSGHVARRHKLLLHHKSSFSEAISQLDDVNSYHDYGCKQVSAELNLVATSGDGVVMAIEHKTKPVYGVMWHSEREQPFSELEKQVFRQVFK